MLKMVKPTYEELFSKHTFLLLLLFSHQVGPILYTQDCNPQGFLSFITSLSLLKLMSAMVMPFNLPHPLSFPSSYTHSRNT